MDVGPLWARLPEEVKIAAWSLVKGGWSFEANRILTEALGDGREAMALVAWLTRRKLRIHN